MIRELERLTGIKLPFKTDKSFRVYLESVNTVWYNLRVLEKDFYLTAILGYISVELPDLCFKWWTCLNKIHFPYFRLSEDLDFSIDINNFIVNTIWKREKFATHMKDKVKNIADIMWWEFDRHNSRAKWNKYIRSYKYTYLRYDLSYKSIFWWKDSIKVELNYTHKHCEEPVMWTVQHIFNDIISEESIFPHISIKCIDISEMIAEKVRAALTRQTPAIRDFYDLRYLVNKWYNLNDQIKLIVEKCDDVQNIRTIEKFLDKDTSEDVDTFLFLKGEVDLELTPVLISLWEFNLEKIYNEILWIKKHLTNQ